MTKEQRERIGTWVRWALALLLVPAMAFFDSHYAKTSDIQRIEAKLDRVLDVACEGRAAHRACQ